MCALTAPGWMWGMQMPGGPQGSGEVMTQPPAASAKPPCPQECPGAADLARNGSVAHDRVPVDRPASVAGVCMASSGLEQRLLVSQKAEKGADVCHQRLGLLKCGEVTATLEQAPAPDIGKGSFRQRSRRAQDSARERRIGGRHINRPAFGNGPGTVSSRVIGPEGRVDRTGEPVQRNVCQQVIPRDRCLGIATAIGPGAELLGDPRRQAEGRVGQGICGRVP